MDKIVHYLINLQSTNKWQRGWETEEKIFSRISFTQIFEDIFYTDIWGYLLHRFSRISFTQIFSEWTFLTNERIWQRSLLIDSSQNVFSLFTKKINIVYSCFFIFISLFVIFQQHSVPITVRWIIKKIVIY